MKNDPFFTVMICCYNSEKYLNETLSSISNQTFKDFELVIVDDGSLDKTKDIIKSYVNNDFEIKYHYQKNSGFASARNKALELSKGSWIAIIDHDDVCLPNRLEQQYLDIINNPKANLFFSNAYHMDYEGNVTKKHFDVFSPKKGLMKKINSMNELLRNGCFINSQTVVFSKKSAFKIGKFDEKYKYIVDYDFFLRMASKFNFFCSHQILSKWRSHPDQATSKMFETVLTEHLEIYWKYLFQTNVKFFTRIIIFLKYIKNFSKLVTLKK